VEKFAIKRTAVLIQPEQYTELQSLIHRMRRADDQEDMLTLGISDMEFHKRICEWWGKNLLVRVWRMKCFNLTGRPFSYQAI
jgi:DNA-binding GntR family transcriptional regulator